MAAVARSWVRIGQWEWAEDLGCTGQKLEKSWRTSSDFILFMPDSGHAVRRMCFPGGTGNSSTELPYRHRGISPGGKLMPSTVRA